MSTLHIFSKPLSYYNANQLENLIQLSDTLLLVGDACFAADQYRQFTDSVYLLEPDATARAIQVNSQDTLISYAEFVALCLSTKQSISW
ncbi:DsrH/TusB family sulfur relay protein [Pseudoalteromonas sp.]|uniref:DsrH/TusB family sulfur relay protein n=1 Tax=Pseudoalteromonas sp. TaxID=53249 RepID=UPI003562C21C